MVTRPGTPVRSVNAGEFDPGALSRIDTKQFYSGAKRMKGLEPVPQSGFRLMGGTRRIMAARPPLASLAITGAAFSPGPHAAEAVIWTGTAAGKLAALHLPNLSCSAGTAQIIAEALIGGVWTAIAPAAFSIKATHLDRTAAFPPQGGRTITALRIRAIPSAAASFTLGTVTAWTEAGAPPIARYGSLSPDDGSFISCMVSAGIADFADASGYLGSALLPLTTAAMLGDLDFYGEADTIALTHPSPVPTQRIRRFNQANHEWAVDEWPYDPPPNVILDGSYVRTDDVWDIMVNWEGAVEIFMTLIIDGEQTPAIALRHGASVVTANLAVAADWNAMAAALETALEALPSLNSDVSVTASDISGTGTWKFTITFGGALAGDEYQVAADIVNTVKAAANVVHVSIGETDGEPLFSVLRGYPGFLEPVAARLAAGRIPGRRSAVAMSKTEELFDYNIKGQNDAAARLDALRSQTTETVLSVKASKYVLVFTDRSVYFAVNRTIVRNEPLNFVPVSETGIRPNTKCIDLDGVLYFISHNGAQLLSLIYDDVSTSYSADPQSLLASHLINGVMRAVRQKSDADRDASKLWLLREDGRMICGQIIRNQDITGFCEWIVADGGFAREIGVDGGNALWLLIQRGSVWHWEIYEPDYLLQSTLLATSDLDGVVSGLEALSGEVWAVAGDAVFGPFTIAGAAIALGDFHEGEIHVGKWTAPEWESMPQPYVLRNDEILFRPGRIHTAHVNVIDTTSIAIGANGGTAYDEPLRDMADAVNAAVPPKTRMISRTAMLGSLTGPTLRITQVRPGRLRVRDLAMEAEL